MSLEIECLKYVFTDNRIVYASVPITTGWRYLEWLGQAKDSTDQDLRYREVITPNIVSARKEIKKLRRRLRCTVIDPTQFEDAKMNWSQEDYYSFWNNIIKYIAKEIVFMDGWECSTGCCHELISALDAEKPIFTQNHTPLSVEKATEMIGKSLEAYRQHGIENTALERILTSLSKYSDAGSLYDDQKVKF